MCSGLRNVLSLGVIFARLFFLFFVFVAAAAIDSGGGGFFLLVDGCGSGVVGVSRCFFIVLHGRIRMLSRQLFFSINYHYQLSQQSHN